jgi:hypothetical protein
MVRKQIPARNGGAECPAETYLSSGKEVIVISSLDMDQNDADRFAADADLRKQYEDKLFESLTVGSRGRFIGGATMVKHNYFDFTAEGGDSGVDLVFEVRAEFETAEPCHAFKMAVAMGMTIPGADPADFQSDESKEFCRDFVANQMGVPAHQLELTSRRLVADQPTGRRLRAASEGVTLTFDVKIEKMESISCTNDEDTQANMRGFLQAWKEDPANRGKIPHDQFARMEAVLFGVKIEKPVVDMSTEDTHNVQKDESYAMECPVNCIMTDWTNSTCNVDCGGGLITSTRSIERPAAHGGIACGAEEMTTVCNAHACDPTLDCKFEFGPWTACSKTCADGAGAGTQCRRNLISAPGSAQCPGEQCRECNTDRCGPTSCNNKYTVPPVEQCRQQDYCCDTAGDCFVNSLCTGRPGLTREGTFCQPDWYRLCGALSDAGADTLLRCKFEATVAGPFTPATCVPIRTDCRRGDIIRPPTTTTDAECVRPTECIEDEYQSSHAIFPLVDRQCSKLTVTCDGAKAPIDIEHDSCGGKAPFCSEVDEYITSPPTSTSDTTCSEFSTCSAAQCAGGAMSKLSDRVCLTIGLDHTLEADYREKETEILAKIAVATEGLPGVVGMQLPNVVTKTASLVNFTDLDLTGSDDAYDNHGHRLVVDLAVKVPNVNFDTVVLAKTNPAQSIIEGYGSQDFKTAVCQSFRHILPGFTCAHLHVYSVNCAPIRNPPALTIRGDETTFVEQTQDGSKYTDAGADCVDNVDGEIRVRSKGVKNVNLAVAGEYKVKYTCKNTNGDTTIQNRLVIVHHIDCPACTLIGEESETIEASFPFVDHAYLKCADIASKKPIRTSEEVRYGVRVLPRGVNTEVPGVYTIIYSATDNAGMTNTMCRAQSSSQSKAITRTVKVVDTLKPVIGLNYRSKQWFPTRTGEISHITGRQNPIYDTAPGIHAAKLALLAATPAPRTPVTPAPRTPATPAPRTPATPATLPSRSSTSSRGRSRRMMEQTSHVQTQHWGIMLAVAAVAAVALVVSVARSSVLVKPAPVEDSRPIAAL